MMHDLFLVLEQKAMKSLSVTGDTTKSPKDESKMSDFALARVLAMYWVVRMGPKPSIRLTTDSFLSPSFVRKFLF